VIKLHTCNWMWAKSSIHPCWKVEHALRDAGVQYERVEEPHSRRTRQHTFERTGQKNFPWIEFEDGTVYREESKNMAETIRAGRLGENRRNHDQAASL
jgi:hypothetical protein